jgi:hypothetical protein
MAEPPERPHPDRYDALLALENAKGDTSKEENSKPVEAAQDRSTGGPRTSHMPVVQAFVNEYHKDAQAHMQQVHQRAKQAETDERNDKLKATAEKFEKIIEGATMTENTGGAKGTAAGTETRDKADIARENLAHDIAAEKQNTAQKENTKGKERGDD